LYLFSSFRKESLTYTQYCQMREQLTGVAPLLKHHTGKHPASRATEEEEEDEEDEEEDEEDAAVHAAALAHKKARK
jgi:hypothetical protein